VTITIEAIFFKIRNLLLEWSGQLIFLGLSHEWIYQHVCKDKHVGGELYEHLRQHRNKYQIKRADIEERLVVVVEKS
jgi:IS30 family transposase